MLKLTHAFFSGIGIPTHSLTTSFATTRRKQITSHIGLPNKGEYNRTNPPTPSINPDTA